MRSNFYLAAILGLHSMLSQDQYHASIANKGQADGATFESLVKASMPKPVPLLPDNATDTSKTAQKVSHHPLLKHLSQCLQKLNH